MSELKRCPFCGGKAKIDKTIANTVSVECTVCHASSRMILCTEGDIEQKAIEAWNTRKPMQNIVERLEENLQKIEEKRKMAESEADKLRFFNFEMALRKAVSIVKEEGGIDGSNL